MTAALSVLLDTDIGSDVDDALALGVLLAEAEVRAHMDDSLSMAAINRPDACVVSGAVSAINNLGERLAKQGVESRRVHIRVAAHSELVEPILAEFGEFLGTIKLQPPRIRFVSNVTGAWITDEEATTPEYWVRHLRQTVRFSDGLETL